jgi:hypothetical protein
MLRDLGPVADLWAEARESGALPRLKVNSHVHLPPNFSAFSTIAEAVDLAADQDVRVLGASNYYDWSAYLTFAQLAQSSGIFPIFGLEVICMVDELREAGVRANDPGNPGKMYVCAKGLTEFDPMNAKARRLIDVVRRNDSARIATMIAKLDGIFATSAVPVDVDEKLVKEMVRRRHGLAAGSPVYLQERHVAQAFQEALFSSVPSDQRSDRLAAVLGVRSAAGPHDPVAIQQELRAHLIKAGKPGFVPETYVDFAHVYNLVLALGGIPCYTIVADGMQPISELERSVDQLIASVTARRIFCSELVPNRNTPEVLDRYLSALRAAGLIVLAGTEHNTLEMVPMDPACIGGAPIPEHLKGIFWEGACVVAAHQFLVAHGRIGYVDADGQPNAAYASAEERITSFASLGAVVIHAFCRTSAHPR